MSSDLTAMLYVPGSSERMLSKIGSVGASAYIVDLEDAVAESAKPAARVLAAQTLRERGVRREHLGAGELHRHRPDGGGPRGGRGSRPRGDRAADGGERPAAPGGGLADCAVRGPQRHARRQRAADAHDRDRGRALQRGRDRRGQPAHRLPRLRRRRLQPGRGARLAARERPAQPDRDRRQGAARAGLAQGRARAAARWRLPELPQAGGAARGGRAVARAGLPRQARDPPRPGAGDPRRVRPERGRRGRGARHARGLRARARGRHRRRAHRRPLHRLPGGGACPARPCRERRGAAQPAAAGGPARARHLEPVRRAADLRQPGRLRRHGDQGRAPARRRRAPLGPLQGRRAAVVEDDLAQQARDRARPEQRGGTRRGAPPRGRLGRADRELPARAAREVGPRPGGAARAQPAARDRARDRLRADRALLGTDPASAPWPRRSPASPT